MRDSTLPVPAEAPGAADPSAPAPAPGDPLHVPVRVGEILKVSLKTVYNKIKQYGLEP